MSDNEKSKEIVLRAQDFIVQLIECNPQIPQNLWASAILNVFVFGFSEQISFNEFKKNVIETLEDYKEFFDRIE